MALIDRDATLERMKSMAGCATCDNYNYVRCRACGWDDAMNIVEEMSEVKAVPVIRCRDCKYGKLCFDANGQGLIQCTNPYYPAAFADTWSFDLDWYCAGGERRDGE